MSYQAAALNLLGDPTRRSILEQLRVGPLTVGEIAGRLPVSRPAVSKHLALLREADLVTMDTKGTRHLYRLRPDGFELVISYWDEFWDSALEQFKRFTEEGVPA